MSKFMGGSAFSMARDIGEGFVQVSERSFRNMSAGDMNQLAQEIDRHMRDLRGEPSAGEETAATQARQRKILRLRGALTMLRAYQQKTRKT